MNTLLIFALDMFVFMYFPRNKKKLSGVKSRDCTAQDIELLLPIHLSLEFSFNHSLKNEVRPEKLSFSLHSWIKIIV